jgi:hypothetical protein
LTFNSHYATFPPKVNSINLHHGIANN